MGNFGPLAAEICWRVWGTRAYFNGFLVLAALLHGTLWASAKPCGVEQRAPPIFGRAAIPLGIGPHSSSLCCQKVLCRWYIAYLWMCVYVSVSDLRLTAKFEKQFVVVELVPLIVDHTWHVASGPTVSPSVRTSVCHTYLTRQHVKASLR